jgi:hypothetical protein
MRIALHDADDTRFPNLALMKLAAFHRAQGDQVERFNALVDRARPYHRIYSSKVMAFTPMDPYLPRDERVVFGGPGYNIMATLPNEVEHMCPDYSIYNLKDRAYGFTTRGCIRRCEGCIVPEKEGGIRPHAHVEEFWSGQKELVLLDNNNLAHPHGIRQLEKIAGLPVKLDCNQGLDARLVDRPVAKVLARIKWIRFIRFACDHLEQMPAVANAINLIREESGKVGEYFVYVLVKDVEDALERVEFLRTLNVTPFAQPFRDFHTNAEPTQEQKDFAQWVNRMWTFKSCSWADFEPGSRRRKIGAIPKGLPLLEGVEGAHR